MSIDKAHGGNVNEGMVLLGYSEGVPLVVGAVVSDIPGDSGSQLPYQEFPPQSPGPYLIGISHFQIQVDSGCECPSFV